MARTSPMSAIRDTVRAAGFTEVPLFQCDWSSNFLNNGLDDLLWTINFGTGADIDKQFAKLKEVRPDAPLMCSEFWSGWFDHWGRKHETRDGQIMVDGLKEMMDKGISFSLYMTHGERPLAGGAVPIIRLTRLCAAAMTMTLLSAKQAGPPTSILLYVIC